MRISDWSSDVCSSDLPVTFTDAEWKQRLSSEQYHVLRDHGTERAGSSPLDREKRKGTFHCAGCDQPLFASATKFDSGTGWPSFYEPIRSEEHPSELQSLMRISYAVFCLQKKQ